MPLIEFTTIAALAGLILIIPIILLYLLKPKPKHVRFPTVMFILDTEKKRKFRTFLKKIFRDPLLIIQLLLISLLVLAAAGPYFFSNETENSKENAVIILDSSASMQATDMEGSRFAKAVSVAQELLQNMNDESRISVVLAESAPLVLSKNQSKKNVILSKSFVSDTPSNIADAMLFSKDLLSSGETNKKVYVISDFAQADSSELLLAQKILSQSNITVKYAKVKGSGGNIGIIDAKAKRFVTDRGRFYLTFTVKNYFGSEKKVAADIIVDNKTVVTLNGTIPAGDQKLFSFEGAVTTAEHRVVVRLRDDDMLIVDNTASMFLPKVKRYGVLLISDEEKDRYLIYALLSSKDIELRTAIPPVIPSFEPFDVIIFGSTKYDYILPGTFRDLGNYVSAGGHAIFLPSSGINSMESPEFHAIMPVELGTLREKRSSINILINHEIFTDIVAKGAETFPDALVDKFIESRPKSNQTTVIASFSESSSNSPAIAYMTHGKGKVLYMGINPNVNWSNIYYSSNFPVFWMQTIDWVTRDESLLGVNDFRTGDYLPSSQDAEVTTPNGQTFTVGSMVLDAAGFYRINRGEGIETIAASLLNEKESDISAETKVDSIAGDDLEITKPSSDVRKDIMPYLIVGVLALIIVEIAFYRRRGLI